MRAKRSFSLLRKVKSIDSKNWLFIFSVLFFLLAFDMSYFVAPSLLISRGKTIAEVGLILSLSALSGILLTPLCMLILKKASIFRLALLTYLSAIFTIVLLIIADSFVVLISLGVFWAFSYNMFIYMRYEIVRVYINNVKIVSIVTILSVVGSMAAVFAPMVAFLMAQLNPIFPLIGCLMFFGFSMLFVTYLMFSNRRKMFAGGSISHDLHEGNEGSVLENTSMAVSEIDGCKESVVKTKKNERMVVVRLLKIVFPVALLLLIMTTMDAVFYTLGPVYWSVDETDPRNAMFMSIYNLPEIFMVLLLPLMVARIGKKRTALLTSAVYFLLAGLLFLLTGNYLLTMVVVFFSSVFGVFPFPALNGAFMDYINEVGDRYSKEMESIVIFIDNLGFFIGPLIAGFVANSIGNAQAISLIAGVFFVVTIILWFVMPRKIHPANL